MWERRKKAKASVFGHTLYRFVEEKNGSKDQRIKENLEKGEKQGGVPRSGIYA